MTSSRGRLIVFEGPDGVGKTTLVSRTALVIRRCGRQVRRVSFPGRDAGSVGRLVYDVHHDPWAIGLRRVDPLCLQALHVAAHLDSIARVIKPALKRGTDVVLDRYWWSTWVYGRTSGLSEATLRALLQVEWLAWGKVRPAVVLLVGRDAPLRQEEIRGWRARVRAYRALVRREAANHPVALIDNSGTVDDAMRLISPYITHGRRR